MSIDSLEVWLDAEMLGAQMQVGVMHHEHGHIRFEYLDTWLDHPLRFQIDPHLSLDKGNFHPRPELGSFGMLLDSSPDRWGQTLMKRRETQDAKDEGRKPRTLYPWDFLIGVQDQTRQGALRFKRPGTDQFLDDHKLPAPPLTELAELENVALMLSDKRIDDLDALRRWLSVLVAPGASLGGARPKANFRHKDGSLWIAKFPARNDEIDVAAWEMLTLQLAKACHIDVPDAILYRFGSDFHTFCIKRFDRVNDSRVFYASAMTLLEATESNEHSYLELAQIIQTQGDPENIKTDLEQLFRRVIFNILVGNKDDHLRNHGYILTPEGWRLSKAFDVNPNVDKHEHVLNIDDGDNRPDIQSAIATAVYYDLSDCRANEIADDIRLLVSGWRDLARQQKIARAEIELMEQSFL